MCRRGCGSGICCRGLVNIVLYLRRPGQTGLREASWLKELSRVNGCCVEQVIWKSQGVSRSRRGEVEALVTGAYDWLRG